MGNSEPPYMYANTQSRPVTYPYSNFNPKAVTQASYASLASTQAPVKRDGPLINFNQHPDSYMIVPGHNTNAEPMPRNTKKKVAILRWIQLALRLHQAIGSVGLLVATICITHTHGAVTFLLRIPPAWDTIVSLYACVHLMRPAKARTPASSASYHFFSLFMDAGVIPFYVFCALVTNNTYQMAHDDGNRWSSFFGNGQPLEILFQAIWIGSAAMGGLHLASVVLDIWLVLLFRRISKLPPDMNPLEENLTSRRSLKHKHKNSEFTLASEMSPSEKKLSVMSGSTLSLNDSRVSMAGKETPRIDTRNVPFGHSRTGSTQNLAFSPHNPESARKSRQYERQSNFYNETVASPERSRYEVRPDGKLQVRSRRGSRSPSKNRGSTIGSPMTGSEANRASWYSDARSDMSPVRFTEPSPNTASPMSAVRKQQEEGLLFDDPYEYQDDVPRNTSRHDFASPQDRLSAFEPVNTRGRSPAPQPLGMNPPTPPPGQENVQPEPPAHGNDPSGVDRSLTVTSNATNSSSVYSESAPSLKTTVKHQSMPAPIAPGTPRGKQYGDLASATRGVRGSTPVNGRGVLTPGNAGGYNGGGNVPPSMAFAAQLERHSWAPTPSPSPPKHAPQQGGRVISRSGADIADEGLYQEQQTGYGMRSRRDVSGKIAEEGRGGGMYR